MVQHNIDNLFPNYIYFLKYRYLRKISISTAYNASELKSTTHLFCGYSVPSYLKFNILF